MSRMGKKICTTYVDVVLRCGTTTSGPVAAFEFDHTEDAVHFATDLLGRLDVLLLPVDEICGVHYDHTHIMRDYVTIYIDCCNAYDFENVWPAITNVCQIFQAFEKSATGSTVVEFPYGY